jgi:hypothetical protein
MTPSRNILTPRGTRAVTIGPETPFTRQLNALLSDGHGHGHFPSPSHALDFSAFPTFMTPGRAQFSDFMTDDFLSSDMPLPSSPPKTGLGLGFELYEDPSTSTTAGLWSGVGMFDSDAMMMEFEKRDAGVEAAHLKMNVGGVTVDFTSMIEEVVAGEQEEAEKERMSLGVAGTPEGPVVE